ncbi:MAG: condensation domain-containing protein, partial [Pseudomonadota bacterium]
VWLSLATSPETAALEAALATLTAHHRGLSFAFDQGRAALGAPRAPELLTFSVGTPPEEIEARVIDALDLARGATLAAGRVGGDLFLAGHHAVTDIATWRFLLSDLAHLLEEPDAPLAPVPSWRGYLSALKDRATAQRRDAERLPPSDVASVPAALRDRLAHATRADLAAGSSQVAGDELEGLLGVLARHPALRLEDALTAGLSAVLQARVGAAGRRIDLERHGRDIPGVDALGLAGWCTLFCPLLLDKGQAATGAALFAAASVRRAMPDEGKLWLAWKWSSEDDATRARARAVPPALALVNLQRSDFSERRHEAARPGAFRLLERNAAGMIGDDVPFSHPLELNARLEEGALCFDILAHPALGAADGIARALADWLGALSGAEMEHVASDVRLYPQAPWSQNQLSEAEARWRRRAPETRFEDVLPLSPQQYGMQIEALAGEASAQHVEQVALTFESPLDEERLESAWARVVAAHPALRTVFVESQGDWAQIVLRHGPRPVSRGDTPLERVARDEMRAFAPDETAFIRLVLCEGGRGLVLTVHHAILDGWSLARVLADIALAYGDEAHAMAHDPGMAPYLAWLGDRLPDADFWQEWEEALPAWSRIEPAERSAARTVARVLSAQLVERISATARGAGLSPAALSQVALAAVLMADEGRAETAFFVTDAGRPEALPESAEAVGLFIATLPIAFRAQSAPPLEAARAMAGKLREAVGQWPPTPLKRPVSDVLLVFENYPTAGETSGAGMARISDVKSTGARTRFPLTFLVIPGETWRIDCVHTPAQIGEAQVAALLTSYEAALDALTGEGATWESVTAAAKSAFGGQRLPRRDAKALERLSVSPDEAELADIWEKVLGHKAFGLEDRFDQAGGHSLGLLHLATEIDKRLGKKIAVSALAAAPTLRSQARLLSDEPIAGRSAVSPLRLMQAQAGRSPKLLILPGAAGEPSAYRALQEELPADWHIEIASYEAPGAPDALAQALAQALADRRDAPARPPAGPWTILGHSFGAALAASVAARLGKRAIKSLLLLDQPTPDLAPASPERSDETLASEIAEAARRYHGKEVALGGGGTAPERLARALAHAGLLADRGASAEIGAMIIARYRAALDGLEGWRPPKLDVPVCILRASESEATGPIEDPS